MSLVLALSTAVLFSVGTWLLLQRRLTRLIVGLGILGNGSNLLLLQTGHSRGVAPIVGSTGGSPVADPMPQALALTAIVISFGVTAFLLALAYRSWQLTGDDLVEDDLEDRRIASARTTAGDEEVSDLEALTVAGLLADAGGEAGSEDPDETGEAESAPAVEAAGGSEGSAP